MKLVLKKISILLFFIFSIPVFGQYPANTYFSIIEPPTDATAPGYLSTYDDNTTSTRMMQITRKGSDTHNYPKRQTWNIDGTKYKILTTAIYDANTHEAYKNLSGLGLYESVWSNTDPNIIYGFRLKGKIKRYNIETKVVDLLYDLNGGSEIYDEVKLGPGEGNIDIHDKYVALIAHVKNTSDVRIIIFDLQSSEVVTTKTFEGMWRNGRDFYHQYIDWVSVSQSGNYLGIMWNHNYARDDSAYVDNGMEHYGVELYNTTDLTYLRRLIRYGNHGDFGFAPDGSEVFAQFYGHVPGKYGSVFSYHLDGSGVDIIHTNTRFEVNGSHLSCRNILRPGWAYLNTKTYGGGDGRMIAVKLDGSEIIENFGHSFEKSGDDFYAYAAPVPNPTGTKIMFKSNFGNTSSRYNICSYEAYPILNDSARALSFLNSNYNNGYLITYDANNFVSGNDWTIEAWVKFDNFNVSGNGNHIMRLGGQLFVDNERHLKVKVGDNFGVGSTVIVADKWYHLAYVRTETEITLYLNGESEIITSGTDAGSANRFLLGTFETLPNTCGFSGIMDEVRLWNDARSQVEIQSNMNKELNGSEENLLIYYNFNNGTGATVVDRAGGDNNGTLVSMDATNWNSETPFKGPLDELLLPKGTELLSNNYFNDLLNNWGLYGENLAILSMDQNSVLEGKNSALVHVSNTSFDSWKIQLRQLNISDGIKANHDYHIQYRVKSNKTVDGIYSVIQQIHGSFANVYENEIILTENESITIVDTFHCSETDTLVEWAFNLGTASVNNVDIWFDAVHIIDLGDIVDVEETNNIPKEFSLLQNYPNPFNPETVINFTLPKQVNVKLSVYNLLGEEVAELVNGNLVEGNHKVIFNASDLSSGIYIYRISAGNFVAVKKMMLLK